MNIPSLPVTAALPELRAALASRSAAVLQAPPGAGKTTLVPLALRDEPWLAGRRIVMLEPRRLATRAAAHRMATLLGEPVGGTVGYRVRRDTRVGRATRIEVVTEGILTRMLNGDPTLDGVGLVIFDEFHERSLQGDLGLALALNSQRLVRPDLRLLVMSATLDADPVAGLLGGAPCVSSVGRQFPVDVRHLPPRAGVPLDAAVAAAVRSALDDGEGDVLAFLPGRREIQRVAERLASLPPGVRLFPLYGDLSFQDQDRAVAPSPPGTRKIVLATSIAESSLTIDGVRCVVDAGLARIPRFSPRSGMTELATVRVSRASAAQRAGRAGRVAAGLCLRLWPLEEQAHLLPFAPPEMAEADLAPLVLDLAAAGISDTSTLSWLTPPPPSRLAAAREVLGWLGALDPGGRITAHGVRMAAVGAHPRIAHLLVRGAEMGMGATACDIAALLDARDVLRPERERADADLHLRLEAISASRGGRVPASAGGMPVQRDVLTRVLEEARAWRRQLRLPGEPAPDADAAGVLLALAFPDRVALRREGPAQRYRMRNGAGAVLRESPHLHDSPCLAIALTDGAVPEARVNLAAQLDPAMLPRLFADAIEQEDVVAWDPPSASVQARRLTRLGALVLRDARLAEPDPADVRRVMLQALRESGLDLLDWNEAATRLRARLAFLHRHDPAWPDVGTAPLADSLDAWLGDRLVGVRTARQAAAIDLVDALLSLLDWSRRSRLDLMAPTHVVAPTGSRLPIDYDGGESPVVRVRLQEMFGCTDTPRVLGGRVPVTLHLLSPAQRPVQVTQDLRSFWNSSYADVRRDLRGRYPRHAWPEDPLAAQPTRRVKRRGD